ncbi:MAG TPA: PilZ domain-containing protein [Tepidisphaeraceae bacterium]|jgi:hypothetical protein
MLQIEEESVDASPPASVPPQVELILSALETGRHRAADQRDGRRQRYRVRGRLRLFSDAPHVKPWTVYTRDVDARGLGFVTPHRLPLGYGGLIELPHPDGGMMTITCTLFRCRQAAPGWYEGAVYFNREQPEFAGDLDDGREAAQGVQAR